MFEGFHALLEGMRLVSRPGLRRYVIAPVLIILVLYAITLTVLVKLFSHWQAYWIAQIPDWLSWLSFILVPLFAIALLILAFFTFTLVVNLLASPFYGYLVEAVERELGESREEDTRSFLGQACDGFMREIQKLRYILPRMLLLFILGWIPVINIVTPLLWLIFSAWSMAIEYLDYAMDSHGVKFTRMKVLLNKTPVKTLGFGAATGMLLWVPVLNLLVMPGAVAAGALMWRNNYRQLNKRMDQQ